MSKYSVVHLTRYVYPSDVTDSANQFILSPKSDDMQQILKHQISVSPKVNIDVFSDYFGNEVGVFTIVGPHRSLEIRADMEVFTFASTEPIAEVSVLEQWADLELKKWEFPYIDFLYLENINCKAEVNAIFDDYVLKEMHIVDVVRMLSTYIYTNFTYRQGVTTVESTVDEIWKLRAGVCQDFAHLLITMLRMQDIPSRYISGYICPSNSEMRGEGATHAWVEVYIPSVGWRGIDPTNNCWVSDRHIKIAYGRDFKDCTPVKGTYKGPSAHTLTVSVIITNENTKEKTAEPIEPAYVSVTTDKQGVEKSNSYQRYLEMQQQQQQQQ
ncbi:transglutaminase family protein [Sphingobacterium pedocola]|uniref:Transglutaminase family protein n=1 Tax=Sphingobacterium pedocola TaxID=2082722 RepID=A0ABR9T4H2_9SPHI|nr:transglutaminase family protein [Sphingobacterium pedocola]MBE8720175.1 transglutaminase family protein [Sphingobacterium pedocola]